MMKYQLNPGDLPILMSSLNPEIMVTEVVPRYEWVNGKQTDKVVGKYVNGYLLSALNIDVSGKAVRNELDVPIKIKMDLEDESLKVGSSRVCGTFEGIFVGKWYWTGKRYALSCLGRKFVKKGNAKK